MKPKYGADNSPVPNVICLKKGEYHLKARFIDPGPWLHIEGAGADETTIVIETLEEREAFDFPPELGLEEKGIGIGFEYGWMNPDVPLFNMVRKCLTASEHDGGGLDLEGFR